MCKSGRKKQKDGCVPRGDRESPRCSVTQVSLLLSLLVSQRTVVRVLRPAGKFSRVVRLVREKPRLRDRVCIVFSKMARKSSRNEFSRHSTRLQNRVDTLKRLPAVPG